MPTPSLFIERFQKIIDKIEALSLSAQFEAEKTSYEYLKMTLNQITLENRKEMKKQIIHFLIDSYQGDLKLGEGVMVFGSSL
ncbi:MAG: hypothetical protein KF734_13410 [Saprospiraceae bacterium]|nr:hypothetical protein [Saprospiraceae bacterium]